MPLSTSTACRRKSASLMLAGLAAALLAAGSASGVALAKEKKPELVSYQKDSGVGLGAWGGKLLHSYGYKDKQLDNGNWEVTGQAKSSNPAHSKLIALYRAAELAEATGKPTVRMVNVNGKQLGAIMAGATGSTTFSGPPISYGTRYIAEVELVDTPDSEAHCVDDVLAESCLTFDVAAALTQIRPLLKIKARK